MRKINGLIAVSMTLLIVACSGSSATPKPSTAVPPSVSVPTAAAPSTAASPTAAAPSVAATSTAATGTTEPSTGPEASATAPPPPDLPNVEGLVFTTNEAAMLAGYAASSFSKTKILGTFGGINIGGPVTDFMDGYVAGANYWNQQHSDTVRVLGWDAVAKTGSFTGNFDSTDDAKNLTVGQLQEGADVILGVGGPIGQGIYDAIREQAADATGVGVDVDWYISDPEDKNLIFTSILKRIDNAVHGAIQRVYDASGKTGDEFHACQISDTGGTDDKSFNANAWQGMQDASDELGIRVDFLDSATSDDYARNINTFLDQGCDIIVTVGFLLGDATQAAAVANPDQKFAIVDFAYPNSAVFVNTLANEGVALGPFHDFDSQVSDDVKAEIAALQAAIIDGTVKPADFFAPAQ